MLSQISIEEMRAAHQRTASYLHKTPIMSSENIDRIVGVPVLFKAEHLQKTGSFKVRGALNSAILAKEENAKGVIAHSSGNHGQALAWAAQKIGLSCQIVVPKNAPISKIDGMKEYKTDLVFCESTASIGFEILDQVGDQIDSIFVSIGGGGLASSLAFLIENLLPDITVILVEPESKNLSNLLENRIPCHVDTLETIADGVRVAHVGTLCEPILRKYCSGNVVSVKEEEIKEAMKLIWTRMKQRIEPSAALAFAGVLYHKPAHLTRPLVILCGGNVDLDYVI
ncbi:hypothetical protein B9Z55_012244 [Caenorhabditis nigoni]|uniref:Serine racemase n=1 Tax=Caenorhabditis nigoni TaxID=1611254 RepID=A0A2G5TWB2_9PELO|nr:hypothetical protein B9Z55_012244 [Caenorhabditis nigoni]